MLLQGKHLLTLTQSYSIVLALASVVAKPPFSRVAARHLSLVLAVVWGVFAYRDLWPILTYTLSPVDGREGWLIWTKIGVLTYAAVVVPLTIPREYIPVDPSVCRPTAKVCRTI